MKETIDEHLTNLIKQSNSYVKMNDFKEINAIYQEYMSFFNISEVEIWSYDANNKKSTLLLDNSKVVTITIGLSHKAMSRKSVVYTNHVISDKEYNASADNIHNYKIKSMLVCPIYRHDSLIGLIYFYRNIGNKKSFTSKDVTNINLSAPILSKMLQNKFIQSDESIKLLHDKHQKTTIKQAKTSHKPPIKLEKTQKITDKELEEEKEKFENEKQEFENEKQEFENEKQKLEDEKQKLEDEKQKLEDEKQKLENEKQKLEDEKRELLKRLETDKNTLNKVQNSLQILTKKSLSDEKNITQLKENNLNLENQNKKILVNNEYIKNRHTFLKKILSEKDESSTINELTRKIYLSNQNNELLMTLFELALFIKDFKEIPNVVEESLKKSKITDLLLNVSNFKNTTMNNEKHNVSILLKKILNNCNTILQATNHKLKIHMDKKTPISLVFNALLVESIITRFIVKIPDSLKKDETIHMSVDFSDKKLHINLNFTMQRETKLVSLFQSNKDLLYNSNQLSHKFNTKLLHSFGGKIHTSYKEDEYKFQLKVPALIIKI